MESLIMFWAVIVDAIPYNKNVVDLALSNGLIHPYDNEMSFTWKESIGGQVNRISNWFHCYKFDYDF